MFTSTAFKLANGRDTRILPDFDLKDWAVDSLKALSQARLRRVGPNKGGHWEVLL